MLCLKKEKRERDEEYKEVRAKRVVKIIITFPNISRKFKKAAKPLMLI